MFEGLVLKDIFLQYGFAGLFGMSGWITLWWYSKIVKRDKDFCESERVENRKLHEEKNDVIYGIIKDSTRAMIKSTERMKALERLIEVLLRGKS